MICGQFRLVRSCGLFPHFTRDGRTEDTGNATPAQLATSLYGLLWASLSCPPPSRLGLSGVGARIEAGALSVSPEPTDAAVLVDRARNTFLSGGGRDNLNIDLPRDFPG